MTRSLSRTALAWGAAGFLGTVALTGGLALRAQSIASHDSRAPVDYAADRIELQDQANRVVLSGGVVIQQADLTLTAARTIVSYDDSGDLRIESITASDGVVVTRGDERASGRTAVYDFGRRIITMAGDVSLRRGSDTVSGGRLVIDLQSGLSSVDGRASGTGASGTPGGRVTGSFSAPRQD
jgi:lipopolysaccharide export system protein LptA